MAQEPRRTVSELWAIFPFTELLGVLKHSQGLSLHKRGLTATRHGVENVPVVVKIFEKYLSRLPCEECLTLLSFFQF